MVFLVLLGILLLMEVCKYIMHIMQMEIYCAYYENAQCASKCVLYIHMGREGEFRFLKSTILGFKIEPLQLGDFD